MALEGNTLCIALLLDLHFEGRGPGFILARGIDCGSADLGGKLQKHTACISAAQDQCALPRFDAVCQSMQAPFQPPARRCAGSPGSGRGIVENVEECQRRAGRHGGGERRVVGEPQIIAKPDDDRTCMHQDTVTSSVCV